MKWTIRHAYDVNTFTVSTTKDMIQALKMLARITDDCIFAETQDGKNTIQYVSVKDWKPFYIVRRYGWKNDNFDTRGIAHLDAQTGEKIDCSGSMIQNVLYEIQGAIRGA